MKNNEVQLRRWFLFAVAAVGILLGILTFTFVNEVRDQLWEQSVGTIIESTRQGENALNIQLREDFSSIIFVKLVDCLEKCLICRHIRRFAD